MNFKIFNSLKRKKLGLSSLAFTLSLSLCSMVHTFPIFAEESFLEDASQTKMATVNFVDSVTGQIVHTKKLGAATGVILAANYMFDIPNGYHFLSKPSFLVLPAENDQENISVQVMIELDFLVEPSINLVQSAMDSNDFDPSLPILVKYPSANLDMETKMHLQKVAFMNSKELWVNICLQ